jgi:calcineurin-like phosphoesterase family protein
MMTTLGPYTGTFVSHHPSIDHNSRVKNMSNLIHLCGHVHNRWRYLYDESRNILNINVGMDVWKYSPVSEEKLVRYIQRSTNIDNRIKQLVESKIID